MYLILKDVFSTDLLDTIVTESKQSLIDGTKPNYWTNYSWPENIMLDSGLVLCSEVNRDYIKPLCETIDRNNIFITPEGKNLGKPVSVAVMLYNWQRYSYIPFHTDSLAGDITCTVFLNKEWDKNWGGANICEVDPGVGLDLHLPGASPRVMEGMVQTSQVVEHMIEYPEYNKMLVNYGYLNVRHSTSILAPAAPDRLTLQMFFKFEEPHILHRDLGGRPVGGVVEANHQTPPRAQLKEVYGGTGPRDDKNRDWKKYE